ncbi:PREDICTED: uncharacterized protein LOC105455480 isoform X2 [Wasmannia auropunctata]|uniref:uncharacterized protein LOC105455480 isoform X2 n=1 Tax=Wasmannia auropunctata TaxID=64793 RepID=UPI0005ED8E63|nr:PREDICTED: uncharacterized protein LOC105455480 isoform X2 [Wasmannia auropunctata]
MPKRSIYLQSSDNLYRRARRDLEFLCNYWDRLLTPNQSYDIRLPELLRANHLMRHISSLSLPSNQGLRVNVSFTILDDGNRLEPEETYRLRNASPYYTESRNRFRRSSYHCSNAVGYNDLRNYIRQINENYATIERELQLRARILAPLIERNRFAGCQNAFYTQRAATYNWNKFPAGNRASCSARVSPWLQERRANPRERDNRQTCTLFGHECCLADRMNDVDGCSLSRQSARQKENSPEFNDSPRTAKECSPQTSAFCATVQKLQQNNINALQNRAGTAPVRNDNGYTMIRQRISSKESMEACQGVSKIISDATTYTHPAESRPVKPDGGVAINNGDKRSIESQPVGCQGNVLPRAAESSAVTDQNAAGQGRAGSKRKLDDLEDEALLAAKLDVEAGGRQERSETTEMIKSRVKDTPTTFAPDGRAVSNKGCRIRNSRIPTEGKPFWKRHVSAPKYASFLRMFRKEETENRLRGNSSSRRNDGEKSQHRRRLSTESTECDNRANLRNERRTPTPRSTVHTTYNPAIQSATDPILDSSGLTIQLLRLAVLLYVPTLMPALNSLIAQQNQQTSASTSSAIEGSNDLLMQIFRLLNEQQTIPNLPLVSIGSERVSTALTAETNGESSRSLSEEKQETTSIALEESDPVSEQGSIFAGKSGWKSSSHVEQQNGKNRKWRLTSMLTDSVRLDRNVFTAEDFRKFEEFLKAEKRRPEDVRLLSTKSKNEIVMKEYFRNWLHRLLRQLNSANGNLSVQNSEERGRPEGSSRTVESSLEEVGRRNRGRLIADESPGSSRDDVNTFSEREEEDSDDQKSFTSATSTNSSRSLQFKQDDAIGAEKEEKLPRSEHSQD